MRLQKHIFFGQFALFCNTIFNNVATIEAMLGHNIRQALADEFPFIAGIIRANRNFDPERDILCTAALITRRDILTSEHCMGDEAWHGLRVVVGSINLIHDRKYHIAWWMSFAQWAILRNISNPYDTNDISILRLTRNVSNQIPNAEISYLSYKSLKRKNVAAVGWGESNNGSYSAILQTANLRILKNQDCKDRISNVAGEIVKVDTNLICSAGNPYTLLMGGDSGGPLIYHNKIIAINMGTCPFPEERYNVNKINVHVNIFFYRQFITDMTANN